MGTDVLIVSLLPGERPPLLQRSCLDTHQRVIKLESTDVVGRDVGCGQRLRNLSDNSTFICGGDKNQPLFQQPLSSLAELLGLASSTPTQGGVCLHKLQSERSPQ